MELLNPLLESLMETLVRTMTREQADAIVAVRADEATQARIDDYADKCNFGTLTPKERKSTTSSSVSIALFQHCNFERKSNLKRNQVHSPPESESTQRAPLSTASSGTSKTPRSVVILALTLVVSAWSIVGVVMRLYKPDVPFDAHPELEVQFSPVTDEEIAFLEKEVGFPIPEDYLQFLRVRNGVFSSNGLLFDDGKTRLLLHSFYGVGFHDEPGNVLLKLDAYAFRQRVPKHYIPIADRLDYDRVVLCLDGPDKGAVFHWRPLEEWEETEVVTEQYLTKIASSFTEFWSRCEPVAPDNAR